MRDSFVFYRTFNEVIKGLSKKQRSIMLDAIIDYGLEGKMPENLTPALLALFNTMKFSIDKAQKRYDASVKNGKRGGAPKGNENAKKQPKNNLEQPNLTKNNLNDNENDNVNDNENVNDNIARLFSPSLTDILVYASELGIDNQEYCEKFYNHYESIGWVNGTGQEIKNWKLVFLNWCKKDAVLKNNNSDLEKIYEDDFGRYRINEDGKRVVC